MADQREGGIAWTDETWNPTRGCSRISPGCGGGTPGERKGGCYAERMAIRLSGPGQPYEGLVESTEDGPRWTGKLVLDREKLLMPLRWRQPRKVFVDSMSDLFHDALTDADIASVFGVMAACPQHTFQLLTKRADRMRAWFAWVDERKRGYMHGALAVFNEVLEKVIGHEGAIRIWNRTVKAHRGESVPTSIGDATVWPWPLPNVWLGVSVENQKYAESRVPDLVQTPASVRWISYEPALGPVDWGASLGIIGDRGRRVLRQAAGEPRALIACATCEGTRYAQTDPYVVFCSACRGTGWGIHWIVAGAESGPDNRVAPEFEAWMRTTRDQCTEGGIAFLYKQTADQRGRKTQLPLLDGQQWAQYPGAAR